ncbi:MAG: LLM class flavin-dependent oxidoreductase [Candidatus Binatia bacterium]|jgi:alkanesulfonate monooxygenase SsuD/methylene tetrahydromethanopterin reductase-like flavin-dependent oxidoreductase (luciferase family)|nr:LLM class flavin-dependent oxidoreductase [Candidatus Binatia bacterium]
MYLGTAIFLRPLHHPVYVAEQTATLEILSGGKFLFGVGQGYRDGEFQSFGVEKRQRRERLAEGVQIIRMTVLDHNTQQQQ